MEIVEKLFKEQKALNAKITKLNSHIFKPDCRDLVGEKHYNLLLGQRRAMIDYSNILTKRIDDLLEV